MEWTTNKFIKIMVKLVAIKIPELFKKEEYGE
jgi:hypothetical protein